MDGIVVTDRLPDKQRSVSAWESLQEQLRHAPRTWLVTGAGGFIGSHLVEKLLGLGQKVVALDNFSTGKLENLTMVREAAGETGRNLQVRVGDITNLDDCRAAMQFDLQKTSPGYPQNHGATVDYILHQAALGSVPRSIENPLATHRANVDGFVNMLVAARDAGVRSFVYASSSSVYGDHPVLPKVESIVGAPLSPYALSKWINEEYAANFARVYNFRMIGMRYFNVFGARQDPNGPYAAVIPRWIASLLRGEQCTINGDGETSRDFCYIDNVVQANLLAATVENPEALNEVYNIAVGGRTTLNQLYFALRDAIAHYQPSVATLEPIYAPFRSGDVRHSLADVTKANKFLGYIPQVTVDEGIRRTVNAYVEKIQRLEE